jgi:protocatechuate 3,4-dioxygenase beta subunit
MILCKQTTAHHQHQQSRQIMKRLLSIVLFLALAINAGAQQPNPSPQEKLATSTQQNAPSAATATRQTRSRTITGRVVDEGNSPISDATIVSLPAGIANAPQSAATATRIRPTSTDEQGKFTLENLTPGAYIMVAQVPGYVIAPDLDDDTRQQKYYRPGDYATIRLIKGGVITGTITNSSGEPVIGVRVNPMRLRDLKGRSTQQTVFDVQHEWKTDDRGVYRIYGLEPGVYLINAGGRSIIPILMGGYDGDVPTYYPSATRDTATEVTLHSGEEITGLDIRYRDARGHVVSGMVTGGAPASPVVVTTVILNEAATGAFAGMAIAPLAPGAHAFAFDGVPDGEFMVTAAASDYTSGSTPRRITIKGTDVTGIELALAPFGSIEGRVTLEPVPAADRAKVECQNKRISSIEEAVILARLDSKSQPDEKSKEQAAPGKTFSLFPFAVDSTPNNKGEFKVSMLDAARYHIALRLPGEDWYVRAITLPSDPPATSSQDAARNGLLIKSGEHVKGITITLAEGAAGARGRILPATEGAHLPAVLRLHLVPAEKESPDATLRFAEVTVQSDGAFALTNLAPGRYWILMRPTPEDPAADTAPRPVAWDAEGRARLRKEAEAANLIVDLQPCQRLTDYVLRYTPPAKKKAETSKQ